MTDLTPRQQQVYDYLKTYIGNSKYPPSVQEVSEHFGISIRAAYDHIKALEKKGRLRRTDNRPRSIELLESEPYAAGIISIPILGEVAAGVPLFSEENYDGEVALLRDFVGTGKFFALRVKGDSMKDAGINEGDTAILRHQNIADNGEIVVAMLDDAVTLKEYYREKNRVRLQSRNLSYPPLFSQNVRVLGKLRCILSTYA